MAASLKGDKSLNFPPLPSKLEIMWKLSPSTKRPWDIPSSSASPGPRNTTATSNSQNIDSCLIPCTVNNIAYTDPPDRLDICSDSPPSKRPPSHTLLQDPQCPATQSPATQHPATQHPATKCALSAQ